MQTRSNAIARSSATRTNGAAERLIQTALREWPDAHPHTCQALFWPAVPATVSEFTSGLRDRLADLNCGTENLNSQRFAASARISADTRRHQDRRAGFSAQREKQLQPNASGAPSAPSRRIATPLPYNCTPLPPRRSGGKLTITSTASPGNGNEWARMQMPLLLMSRVVPVLSRQTPSDPSQ